MSKTTSENIKQSLTYAKLNYDSITLDELQTIQPTPYSILVLTGENSQNRPIQSIKAFVEQGGRLFVANRFLDEACHPLVGIKENRGFLKDSVYGITFPEKLFPGYPDLHMDTEMYDHSILDVTLLDGAKVYLTSEDYPLLWTYSFGKGKVIYWNTTSMSGKNSRGILLQSISLSTPVFVSAQAGIFVMFIDDFPAPIAHGTAPIIKDNYNMTIRDFNKHVWWKDHLRWTNEFGLKYSAVFIGTYRNDVKLTTEHLIKNNKKTMAFYGRDLLEANGEIGIHGYNHQSLVTDEEPLDKELGYRPWTSQAQMEKSLSRAQKLYSYFFPDNKLQTYVPPSNIIGPTGIRAIHQSLPSINTLASLYVGNKSRGNLVQEFEFDETFPRLYHFPRLSSGYRLDDEEKYIIQDGIANMGVVSHFVHPDDILDPDRSKGLSWEELSNHFEQDFKNLLTTFPYLEPLTISDARKKMIHYQSSEMSVHYGENAITISGSDLLNPSYFLMRVDEDKSLTEGIFPFGEITKLQDAENIYVIKMTKPTAKIAIKE